MLSFNFSVFDVFRHETGITHTVLSIVLYGIKGDSQSVSQTARLLDEPPLRCNKTPSRDKGQKD